VRGARGGVRTALDWVWHTRGKVNADQTLSDEQILDLLEAALLQQRKPITKREHSSIDFHSPLWSDLWGPNWLTLVIYDYGAIWIDRGQTVTKIRYDLRSLHGMIFCLCGALMFAGIGCVALGLSNGLMVGIGAFAWLYGMNMLLAAFRVQHYFRRAVAKRP
jgi:hypothetical protein